VSKVLKAHNYAFHALLAASACKLLLSQRCVPSVRTKNSKVKLNVLIVHLAVNVSWVLAQLFHAQPVRLSKIMTVFQYLSATTAVKQQFNQKSALLVLTLMSKVQQNANFVQLATIVSLVKTFPSNVR
jgi:hypothetical protein